MAVYKFPLKNKKHYDLVRDHDASGIVFEAKIISLFYAWLRQYNTYHDGDYIKYKTFIDAYWIETYVEIYDAEMAIAFKLSEWY